ncbi:hypothetical protein BD769DRAFT_1393101 [Suillus cothurnatus]|nr:hypothetical protein BD769DRAFT_1393101 [Suillus cothurnatus]
MSHGRLTLIPFPKDHGTSDSGEITRLIIQAAHGYTTLAFQARSSRSSKRQSSCLSCSGKVGSHLLPWAPFSEWIYRKKKKLIEEKNISMLIKSTPSVGDNFDNPLHQDIATIGSPPSDNSYGQFDNDDSVLSMDNDLLCPCNSPTLQSLKTVFRRWQKDWRSGSGSESTTWDEVFNNELACLHTKGEQATTIFLDEVTQWAMDGRLLLEDIRDAVHTHCPYCRECLKYDAILLYDLLVSLVSEVKFFEVKLAVICDN